MKKRIRKSNRPQVERQVSSTCHCCATEDAWVENKVLQEQEYRGEMHQIQVNVLTCKHCPAATTTHQQDEENLAELRHAHVLWLKDYVAQARKILGLTVRAFEAKMAISSSTISRISRGEKLVDASTEKLLVQTLSELLTRHAYQTMASQPDVIKNHVATWPSIADMEKYKGKEMQLAPCG
jgi:transcriptional regulator with XRE-family HTH domain